jgi:hypothetical protein
MEPGAADDTGVVECSPEEMAAYDLQQARCALNTGAKQVLPAGTLQVSCIDSILGDGDACSLGSELQIRVDWETRNETLGSGTGDFITLRVHLGEEDIREE